MKKLIFVLLFCIGIGCSSTDINNRNFVYKDKIAVRSGFYKGQTGEVIGDIIDGKILVQLDDSEIEWINVKDLEIAY